MDLAIHEGKIWMLWHKSSQGNANIIKNYQTIGSNQQFFFFIGMDPVYHNQSAVYFVC